MVHAHFINMQHHTYSEFLLHYTIFLLTTEVIPTFLKVLSTCLLLQSPPLHYHFDYLGNKIYQLI
uniref:Uncharacterized protein n=1 Tax=Octopus bimaculoides TaxID=37653 RepID=A0A0L8I9E6_OCTBM